MKKKTNWRWVIKILVLSVVISMVFTLASDEMLEGVGYFGAFLALFVFIFIGVLFDIIGVAVTSASEVPFHSMASHRESGAVEAINLIKNAEKVSSICNDVVGDISGIVSGTTGAVITGNLVRDLSAENLIVQLAVSGAIAGLTIGGKAIGKAFAINKSTNIVLTAGKILSVKSRLRIKRGKRH
jgi:CBS domain containing-hemolysin-like protein